MAALPAVRIESDTDQHRIPWYGIMMMGCADEAEEAYHSMGVMRGQQQDLDCFLQGLFLANMF